MKSNDGSSDEEESEAGSMDDLSESRIY